jgi:hypothetical protein
MLLEPHYYYEHNKLNLSFSIYKDIKLFDKVKFYIEKEIKNWYDRNLKHKHYIILNSELGIYMSNFDFDYKFFQFDILIGFSYRSALASGGKNPKEYDKYNIYTTLFFNQ